MTEGKIAFKRFHSYKFLGYALFILVTIIGSLMMIDEADYVRPNLLRGFLIFGGIVLIPLLVYLFIRLNRIEYPLDLGSTRLVQHWPMELNLRYEDIVSVSIDGKALF